MTKYAGLRCNSLLQVHRTRSTSGMYLPLSITITAAAVLWATYGYLTVDYFVAAPQSVGFLAGVIQLLLFVRSVPASGALLYLGSTCRVLTFSSCARTTVLQQITPLKSPLPRASNSARCRCRISTTHLCSLRFSDSQRLCETTLNVVIRQVCNSAIS